MCWERLMVMSLMEMTKRVRDITPCEITFPVTHSLAWWLSSSSCQAWLFQFCGSGSSWSSWTSVQQPLLLIASSGGLLSTACRMPWTSQWRWWRFSSSLKCIFCRLRKVMSWPSGLLLHSMWWLHWLDPLSLQCSILRCQEQILCRAPELGFEGHTSGPYLLPCLLVEWAGLQVMFWCMVCLSKGALSGGLYANPLEMAILYSVCSGMFWGERWWSVGVVATDGVRPGLGCILQSCSGRRLSFCYG